MRPLAQDADTESVSQFHETRKGFGAKVRDFVHAWLRPNVGLSYELAEVEFQLAFSSAGRSLRGLVRPR